MEEETLNIFTHISRLSDEELAEEISKSKFSHLSETFLEREISGRMLSEIENKNELFEAMESWSDQLSIISQVPFFHPLTLPFPFPFPSISIYKSRSIPQPPSIPQIHNHEDDEHYDEDEDLTLMPPITLAPSFPLSSSSSLTIPSVYTDICA
jgi:hypothetical protein